MLQPRSTEWSASQLTPHVEPVEDNCPRSILHQYKDIWEGKSTGRTDVVEHQIKTITNRPICCHLRKYLEEQQKIIDEEIDKMLTSGVIRLSKSLSTSAVVLEKKKSGDWLFCIDYRLS